MKGVVRLISSICRQFLLGLARLGRGSSRQSVSSLVNFACCDVQLPVHRTEAVIAVSLLASPIASAMTHPFKSQTPSPAGIRKSYRFVSRAAEVLWQSLLKWSRGHGDAVRQCFATGPIGLLRCTTFFAPQGRVWGPNRPQNRRIAAKEKLKCELVE